MNLTLALDVMGGDVGPRITIPAALQALKNDSRLSLLLFGDRRQIQPLIPSLSSSITSRFTLVHTDRYISSDTGVTQALRYSKGTSMRLALEAVQKGDAAACVSGGNTAALMGLAKVLVQPLMGIQRPALVSILPTINGKYSIMLDLGANVSVTSEILSQFALMGTVLAENQFNLVYPRVALLNIGIEKTKGLPVIRETDHFLRQQNMLNYIGFVEGNKLLNHYADVIVCDGFSGNIALKTLEGALKNIVTLIKQPLSNPSWWEKGLKLLARPLLKLYHRQLQILNPDDYNGASLLGLRSVVVKSHGSASAVAFTRAIEQAAWQVRQQIPNKILTGLQQGHFNNR
ncbi:phosphate acyltransferase [Mergibacter septicus]|nr:phosphate acyltransferase PlsX [Mergibacter septicus]AWX13910.1 phosphate acyltransferase [Mergibacter septicus]